MQEIDIGWSIIGLLGGIVVIVFFGPKLTKLLSFTWIGLVRFAIGLMFLFLFNIFGQLVSFQIPLNFITGLTVGVLGIPGILTLIILKLLLI